MADGLDLGVSGLASGFDWRSLIDQLSDVERAPQRRIVFDQQAIQARKAAYGSIATQLSVLQNRVTTLREGNLFNSRVATTSDTLLGQATVKAGAALGVYSFHVDQLATAAIQNGAANVGSSLASTDDVSTLELSAAAFATPIKAGTFTINGKQITIATSDKLSDVFGKISTATGGDVAATYSAATDRISLVSAGGSQIVLGSATDSSNFQQVARLSNNGTSTVTSSSSLGSVKTNVALSSANFSTAISDGGANAGLFKINGVEISFDASTDSVADVLKRINDSKAGVSASYDSVNDRFILTNKTTGDLGVALEDVTGNFLSATGLGGGTLTRGKDLLYTVNGGGQIASHSNTIGEENSGIVGLSTTAIKTGDFTVTVANDVSQIKKAISDFIDDYNRVQALIDTNTASTTDVKGTVSAGTLAGESDAFNIASDLRRIVTASSTFLGGTLKRLESLGITSNGDNDNLALSDATKLEAALTSSLSEVESLFLNDTDGLANRLNDFLESTVGEDGRLGKKENTLERQIADLDQQLTDQERLVQANRQRLIDQFVAMETAQQRINQQLQFLQQRFGS